MTKFKHTYTFEEIERLRRTEKRRQKKQERKARKQKRIFSLTYELFSKRFVWRNENLFMVEGKYENQTLEYVNRHDPAYLERYLTKHSNRAFRNFLKAYQSTIGPQRFNIWFKREHPHLLNSTNTPVLNEKSSSLWDTKKDTQSNLLLSTDSDNLAQNFDREFWDEEASSSNDEESDAFFARTAAMEADFQSTLDKENNSSAEMPKDVRFYFMGEICHELKEIIKGSYKKETFYRYLLKKRGLLGSGQQLAQSTVAIDCNISVKTARNYLLEAIQLRQLKCIDETWVCGNTRSYEKPRAKIYSAARSLAKQIREIATKREKYDSIDLSVRPTIRELLDAAD